MDRITLTLICFFVFSGIIFAQSAPPSREESRQYRIQYTFQESVFTSYRVTCSTTIERTDELNNIKLFNRVIEVYLSFYRATPLYDGFVDVRTFFDSVTYSYIVGSEKYKWSSNADGDFPQCDDYINLIFPILGRSYNTTISPYFEVAKIEGEYLTEKREEIEKITNPFLKAVWEKANSDDMLILYSDMNKNVLREGRFAIDSTWNMRFEIPIEGIRYICDTAEVKFYLYDGKNYNIKAEMPLMYPNTDDSSCVIGVSNVMLKVDSTSNSKGFWDIAVSPRGMIEKVIGKYETIANYSDESIKFTDKITTNIKFEFLKTQKFFD